MVSLIFLATWASLVFQIVKNLLAMLKTWVWSPVWENPLEEGMVSHSSILAWKIPMNRGVWWATVHGVTKSQTWLSDYHFHFHWTTITCPLLPPSYLPCLALANGFWTKLLWKGREGRGGEAKERLERGFDRVYSDQAINPGTSFLFSFCFQGYSFFDWF